MAFKNFSIRYQTPAITPPPFAHFYTLTARPAFDKFLQVDFSITYPDREDLDEEDITGEGFTLNDDFRWSGRLPNAWLLAITELERTLTLNPFDETKLAEGDEFLEITIAHDDQSRTGTPADIDRFQYTIQELIQAAFEAGQKEQPFDLTYLDLHPSARARVHLKASFAERSLTAEVEQQGGHQTRTLPWADLQRIMAVVYRNDYDPDAALARQPTRTGQYLSLSDDVWHDVSGHRELARMFSRLLD